MYNITYRPQESFTVHLPERDIVFHWRDKLYVADFSQPIVAVKAEEARAQAVYEIIRNCGYPLYTEAVHLIQDGNFTHMLMLTAEDVKRTYELFGEPVGSVRGKMTKKGESSFIRRQSDNGPEEAGFSYRGYAPGRSAFYDHSV
jgi:hypothetical protein